MKRKFVRFKDAAAVFLIKGKIKGKGNIQRRRDTLTHWRRQEQTRKALSRLSEKRRTGTTHPRAISTPTSTIPDYNLQDDVIQLYYQGRVSASDECGFAV